MVKEENGVAIIFFSINAWDIFAAFFVLGQIKTQELACGALRRQPILGFYKYLILSASFLT